MKCLSDYLWQTIVPLIFFSFIWMLFKYLAKEKEIENAQKEKINMELKFLKSQINPHVLFNNLNTVYAYSLEKPSETPSLILKLSENLKHVLYESNSEYIPLEKELQYIDNYIDFQKIRTTGIKTIEYSTVVNSNQYKIAPLLLTTIIENAFKHSIPHSLIKISIEVNNNQLTCLCQNEYDKAKHSNNNTIGLSNLKKRLDLLYKEKYTLQIERNHTYSVQLKLTLV